jgi:hypothetical protein
VKKCQDVAVVGIGSLKWQFGDHFAFKNRFLQVANVDRFFLNLA